MSGAERLMKRAAYTDEQQEEHYIFSMETENFVKLLGSPHFSDASTSILHQMQSACLTTFLAGSKKREEVAMRKCTDEAAQKYYGVQF